MSLIRIRRERSSGGKGPNTPPALWKLLGGLVLALVLIWYLSRLT